MQPDTLIPVPLTNRDMERLYPASREHIIEYSDLNKYRDLEEVLPETGSFKIVLIEYRQNSGHWILISRYKDMIEFFNPFGTKHSDADFVKSQSMNKYLGQASMHLQTLLQKEANELRFDIVYNRVRFQSKRRDINTCGRHVLCRLICLREYRMSLKKYIQFMRQARQEHGGSYDQLVSSIIQ